MSFQNCTIRGKGCNPIEYHHSKSDIERGAPDWPMSPSTLKEFAACPQRWKRGYEPPSSDAKDWGSLLDTLVLTPEQFDARYRVRPETFPDAKGVPSTSGNTTACKEWVKACEADGLEIVKRDDLEDVRKAVARLNGDDILNRFLAASDRQVWVIGEWKDAKTGLVIPCQCLVDLLPRTGTEFEGCTGDLKSTRSAAPFVFQRFSSQRGYHVQAAFDLDMLAAAGCARETWAFVLSENFPPYEPGRMILSQEKLAIGRMLYMAWLGLYAQCLTTGKWPGYQDVPGTLDGWSLDNAMPWDEAEAQRAMGQLVEPAADNDLPPEEFNDINV